MTAIKHTENIYTKIASGREKWLFFAVSLPLSADDREIWLVSERFGNRRGSRVSCAARRVDGFVCVYQNTHLIIPRIAVGAESGHAAVPAYSALNSHLDP